VTFAAEAAKAGRKPIIIAELILDFCSLDFGIAPCTAAGAAGSECFNTRETTQDAPNYTKTTKTYRFINTRDDVPAGFEAFPALLDFKITPAELDPGKGLGPLGSASLNFVDFPHHDRGIDPYVGTRLYDPAAQGTFFGKLLARNRHYQGRALKIYIGYVGTGGWSFPGDFQIRQYVIERFSGPDANGKVKLTAKDPLKLADNDRAQVPVPTKETLIEALDATNELQFKLSNGDGYDLIGSVRIGDEVISYLLRTPGAPPGGGLFGPLNRGAFGSIAAEHSVGDVAQMVTSWIGDSVVEVVEDLLTNYTDIDPAFIIPANLDPEGWLDSVKVDAQITEPTGVRSLLSELAQQCLFDLWWDELDQTIRLKALGPPAAPLIVDDNTVIVEGTAAIKSDPNERISQIWLHYDQKDPTQGLTEDGNFLRLYIAADLNSESADEYGSSRVRKIRSRWFKKDDASALAITGRLINRQKDPPARVRFDADAKDGIKVGDEVTITTRLSQDFEGGNRSDDYRVISVEPNQPGTKIRVEAESLGLSGRYARITLDAQVDYGAASDAEKASGGFIAPGAGNFGDGGAPYKVL
jgi:hypothetical protein